MRVIIYILPRFKKEDDGKQLSCTIKERNKDPIVIRSRINIAGKDYVKNDRC